MTIVHLLWKFPWHNWRNVLPVYDLDRTFFRQFPGLHDGPNGSTRHTFYTGGGSNNLARFIVYVLYSIILSNENRLGLALLLAPYFYPPH